MKIEKWNNFAKKVYNHVKEYANKQYSSRSTEDLTTEDCIKAIQKYCERFGQGARGEIEQKRDFLKISHYSAIADDNFETIQNENICKWLMTASSVFDYKTECGKYVSIVGMGKYCQHCGKLIETI